MISNLKLTATGGLAPLLIVAIIAAIAFGGTLLYFVSNEKQINTDLTTADGKNKTVSADTATQSEDITIAELDNDTGVSLREEACPSPGPACPSPQIPSCKNGKWTCIGPAEPGDGAAAAGKIMEYTGTVLAGNSSKLIDFKKADYDAALASGRPILLYFYANWCPICKAETRDALYPAFNELTRDDIVGFRINYNDNETDQNEVALAREFGVAYQHTKVILKNGVRILKAPDSWTKSRYLDELNKL